MTESGTGGRGRPVRGAEAIALVQGLVSIPSLSTQESAAVDWFAAWMAEHGFAAEVDEAGNAIGRRGEGSNKIILLGHIDTFPGDLPVRREGRWLHGRGSVDAKGALSAFACAAASADVSEDWQVIVVGAIEEEASTSRGARHVLAQMEAPQHCVIGEPSGWGRVTLGYKGALQAKLHWRAAMAHSAGPHRLPAEQAVDIWNAINVHCSDFNRGRRGSFDRLEPSLRSIGTIDQDAFADIEMHLGFRVPPTLTPDEVAADVAEIVRRVVPDVTPHFQQPNSPAPGEGEAGLWFLGGEDAFRASKSTDLVRGFLGAIREKGGKPRFVVKTGTSDMNVVGPSWGPSILAYGPGDSSLDHTPDERLDLDEYLLAIEILRNALTFLQSDPGTAQRQCET